MDKIAKKLAAVGTVAYIIALSDIVLKKSGLLICKT